MAFTMPDDSAGVNAVVSWVDSHGHPATVDGATTWASSDNTIAAVQASSSDSTQAVITPVGGKLGDVQITATVDADIGSGVQTITAMGDITVIAGQAVAGEITFTASSA